MRVYALLHGKSMCEFACFYLTFRAMYICRCFWF